jgi:hypothetical protein
MLGGAPVSSAIVVCRSSRHLSLVHFSSRDLKQLCVTLTNRDATVICKRSRTCPNEKDVGGEREGGKRKMWLFHEATTHKIKIRIIRLFIYYCTNGCCNLQTFTYFIHKLRSLELLWDNLKIIPIHKLYVLSVKSSRNYVTL